MSKKNKAGYYRSTFYFNNKRYACYGKTPKEADQKAALKKAAIERGDIGISGRMSVKSWCYKWLDTYKKPKCKEKSYKDYKRYLDNLIIPAIGNVHLKDVTDVHLQDILNSREGYSHSDVKRVRNILQSIFKRAIKSRLITFNPAEFLEMPDTAQKKKRRSITDVERSMILETANTHHAGLWVKTMLYCGLRNGEVIALDWLDIDFTKKLINVSKAKESGNNDIKEPKTYAGVREVPIPDNLLNDLIEAKQSKSPYDPVFTQKTSNKRHTESSHRKSWLNFLRVIDIENGAVVHNHKIIKSVLSSDLSPYYLRHTFCTDLEVAGVPINVASRLMGHSDISVTAKIYTHGTEKALKQAAEKINDFHKRGA